MTALHRTRGILDTSTVILLPRLSDPALLPVEPLITAVILAELSVGPLVARTEQQRAARQAHLQQTESDFNPIPFDAVAARRSDKSPRGCGAVDARAAPERMTQ